MPRPPSVRSTALSAVAAAVVAGIATMVFVDSDLTFELEAGVAVGVTIGCIVGSVPGRSVLMGDERWRDYGLISIATALSRLALTAGVAGHASFLRVIAAVVLSEAVGTFLTVMATRHEPRVRAWPSGSGRRLRIGAAASAGMVLVLVLSSVSSRRRLGSDAQIYNQSASVARIVFALVFAVAFVFFPAMARLPIGSVPLRRTFHSTLLLSIAAALPVVAAVMVFPTEFAEIVTPGTTASVRAVRILTPAFACCGIAVVSFAQYIAHGSRFALSAWPAAIVMLIGLLTASSANGLAWWALITSVILLATASIPALLRVQPLLRPHTIHLADTDQTTSSEGVTIIVPSYNPGRNVGRTVCAIYDSFSSAGVDLRLVVVSDGSTDESPEIIDALDTPNLVHLRHEENRGKGAALRTGFAAAATPIVGFIDADGDLPANQLIEMVRIQQQTGADIVFGSKRHSDSTVSVSLVRRIYSRGYQFLIRHLFQLDIADTQTGIKVYSREVLQATVPVLRERGFALDLELFVAAPRAVSATSSRFPCRWPVSKDRRSPRARSPGCSRTHSASFGGQRSRCSICVRRPSRRHIRREPRPCIPGAYEQNRVDDGRASEYGKSDSLRKIHRCERSRNRYRCTGDPGHGDDVVVRASNTDRHRDVGGEEKRGARGHRDQCRRVDSWRWTKEKSEQLRTRHCSEAGRKYSADDHQKQNPTRRPVDSVPFISVRPRGEERHEN